MLFNAVPRRIIPARRFRRANSTPPLLAPVYAPVRGLYQMIFICPPDFSRNRQAASVALRVWKRKFKSG